MRRGEKGWLRTCVQDAPVAAVPARQAVQLALPPALTLPAGQTAQDVADAPLKVPAGQG